jgi:hypothetical protein
LIPKELNDWLQVLGLFGVLGGLVFVGLQMQQTQSIGNSERIQMRIANTIELNNAINENAEIWERGITGEELDALDTIIFENLIKTVNDFYYFGANAALELGNPRGAEITIQNFAVFLYRNPGARLAFERREKDASQYRARLSREEASSNDWYDTIQAYWAELDRAHDAR